MRKIPQRLTLAAAVLVTIELASLLVSSIGERRLILWPGWQARRAAVIERFVTDREASSHDASDESLPREVIHPYLGFVKDASRVATVNEYGFPGSVNPLGKRSPDKLIVALLGGSPAVELATVGGEALEREILKQPRYRGRDVVLVCLAHHDYKQPQQLMALSYMLSLGAEFDLLVNIDGFNEVALHQAGNAFKRVYPIYPANWYLYTSSAPDPNLRRLIGRQAYVEQEMLARARRYSRAPWRYSLTLNALWGWRQRTAASTHTALGEQMRMYATRDNEKLPYWVQGPPMVFEGDDRLYDLLASVWQRGSLQLAHLARENGMRYLHFLQPDPQDPIYESGVALGYPLLAEAGKQLTAQGVSFTDLTGESGAQGESFYRDGCCRLSRAGIESLARHVGRALAAE